MNPRLNDFGKYEQLQLIEAASPFVPDGGPIDDQWVEVQEQIGTAICDVMPELEEADTYDLENDLIHHCMGIGDGLSF